MIDQIKELAKKYFPAIKDHREHLHRFPELSFEEYKTSSYIESVLTELGISYRSNLGGGTGILAELGEGDQIIALRADIDALPITEESSKPYRSVNDGVMHACGHDVHTSSLLGVAYILKELEDQLPCKVRLIFQPGEEKLPGGASVMIEDGALEDVVAIVGQHVHPDLPVGTIGYRSGYFMASCDEIYMTVKGKGGHAAMPEKVIDPIYVSAEIIQNLQSIISRKSKPGTATVLSIGKINSVGGATNIIPESVKMEGTFRTYDEEWRTEAHQLIQKIATSISEAHGASVELNIVRGYPALYNNPDLTNHVSDGISGYVRQNSMIELDQRMTAEDFSFYSQVVPACFYRLGTSSLNGENQSAVHTPTFDVDPESLEIGAGLMAYTVFHLARHLKNL